MSRRPWWFTSYRTVATSGCSGIRQTRKHYARSVTIRKPEADCELIERVVKDQSFSQSLESGYIVFQQRDLLLLSSFLVLSVDKLKIIDHRSFLTLYYGVTFFDGLSKSNVFASLWQQNLVQYRIRFTCCPADCTGCAAPWFFPRHGSFLQFSDNPVSNLLIKIKTHSLK